MDITWYDTSSGFESSTQNPQNCFCPARQKGMYILMVPHIVYKPSPPLINTHSHSASITGWVPLVYDNGAGVDKIYSRIIYSRICHSSHSDHASYLLCLCQIIGTGLEFKSDSSKWRDCGNGCSNSLLFSRGVVHDWLWDTLHVVGAVLYANCTWSDDQTRVEQAKVAELSAPN